MQVEVKTKNRKKLKVKALVDSGCTHTGIDKQLVKDKRIQTKSINFSFEVFNANGTKNGEMTKVAPLEIESIDNLPFGICCFGLVAECCLDFFYEIIPVLGIVFFI